MSAAWPKGTLVKGGDGFVCDGVLLLMKFELSGTQKSRAAKPEACYGKANPFFVVWLNRIGKTALLSAEISMAFAT